MSLDISAPARSGARLLTMPARVACPGCGTQNLVVATVCRRCRLPLPAIVTSATTSARAFAQGIVSAPRPPAAARPVIAPAQATLRTVPAPRAQRVSPRVASEPVRQAVAADPVAARSFRLASMGRSLLAQFADASLCLVLGLLASAWLAHGARVAWHPVAPGLLEALAHAVDQFGVELLLGLFVGGLAAAVVTALLAGFSGTSIGGLMLSGRLVSFSGQRPSWRAALVRGLGVPFGVLVFGAGVFWPLVSPRRQGWADAWADVVLVQR